MRLLTIDPDDPQPAIEAAADALARGAVVAFPTDTFYGLAVDPYRPAAVDRLYALKGRAFDQPLPLIAGDESQARMAGEITPLARALAARFWPGPLTLVLRAAPTLCGRVHAYTGGVAVRVPAHAAARALARAAGHPITATSANVSGSAPASRADQVVRALDGGVAVILDGGETRGGLPSTIVNAMGEVPVLVRAGIVPFERVLEFSKCSPSTDQT